MTSEVERNRELQRAAYGEPLGEVLRRLMGAFTLNQAGLARVLGLSPPMLSQLISAHRVKIGNPAVLHRMQALEELAAAVEIGAVGHDQIAAALGEIQASSGQWTRSETRARATADGDADPAPDQATDQAAALAVRNLLRAVASGQELHSAAVALEQSHPGLAEVLRVYGLGPAAGAQQHFAAHRELF